MDQNVPSRMSLLATRDLFFELLQVCVKHGEHMEHDEVVKTTVTFAQALADWPEVLKE
jgi:hypothetical protein